MQPDRIRHTVSFRLRHPAGSDAERDFLEAAERLSQIPGVEAFDILAEISPKNTFRFGLSMEFADAGAYEAYNLQPEHVRFVEERWINEVEEFLEIDFAALGP
jgi:Stress responsive A/B Barrel Domain